MSADFSKDATPESDAEGCPTTEVAPGALWFWHVVFLGALAWATYVLLTGESAVSARSTLALGVSVVLAAWYAYWMIVHCDRLTQTQGPRVAYFVVAGLLWLTLLAMHDAYAALGFIAIAHVFRYLPWRTALFGAVLIVSASLVAQAGPREWLQPEGIRWGDMAGPLVGLVIASLIALHTRGLVTQNRERQRLIDRLQATQEELARAERHGGKLEERERLANDIHDTLAQGFTSIVMLLEAAQASRRDGSAGVNSDIEQALRTSRESLAEARRLVWALRPEALERGSLEDALRRAGSQLDQQSNVSVRTVVTGNPHPLPTHVEVTLLRAVQEALNNIRRHARAAEATVTLSYMDEVVRLDIRDDGRGFDPADLPARPEPHGGLGLIAMAERVEALNGTLAVESASTEGSTIVIELPTDSQLTPDGRAAPADRVDAVAP